MSRISTHCLLSRRAFSPYNDSPGGVSRFVLCSVFLLSSILFCTRDERVYDFSAIPPG